MALHAAAAVALGAFLLAAAAGVHATTVPSHASWPLLTGGAALMVAWVVGVLLARPPRRV